MAAAAVHRLKATVSVAANAEPHWETRCGKRVNDAVLVITDNAKDTTCARCRKAR